MYLYLNDLEIQPDRYNTKCYKKGKKNSHQINVSHTWMLKTFSRNHKWENFWSITWCCVHWWHVEVYLKQNFFLCWFSWWSTFFLTTFYGLYFNHQLHITLSYFCAKRASKIVVPPKEMLLFFSNYIFWLTMMS